MLSFQSAIAYHINNSGHICLKEHSEKKIKNNFFKPVQEKLRENEKGTGIEISKLFYYTKTQSN